MALKPAKLLPQGIRSKPDMALPFETESTTFKVGFAIPLPFGYDS
jgi:hypothetical protein